MKLLLLAIEYKPWDIALIFDTVTSSSKVPAVTLIGSENYSI